MKIRKGKWAYLLIDFETAQKYHRLLWRWLARNPRSRKEEWPGWFRFDFAIPNDCFACYMARMTKDSRVFCVNCPATEWRENFNPEPFTTAACQADQYGTYLDYYDDGRVDISMKRVCNEIADIVWTKVPDGAYPACNMKEPR